MSLQGELSRISREARVAHLEGKGAAPYANARFVAVKDRRYRPTTDQCRI